MGATSCPLTRETKLKGPKWGQPNPWVSRPHLAAAALQISYLNPLKRPFLVSIRAGLQKGNFLPVLALK